MSEWQEHIPLKRSQNVQKEKMNKLDYIEIRTLCSTNDNGKFSLLNWQIYLEQRVNNQNM